MRLEVLDFAGLRSWRWRLTDSAGQFVADHVVELDTSEWQFEAFTDLYGYLRWNAGPDRRQEDEAQLVEQVGDWIGQRVLGPVAAALAQRRGPVRLEVPAAAAVLAYRPWELARVAGRTLAGHGVRFLIDQQPHHALTKTGVGDRLRMLAVFSLPEDAAALNLRKERHELARLVQEIARVNNKAIELRVLQYGATRVRLEDALLEHPGWDVVHLSGHGLPAGLVLEDETGRHDVISSTELVDLLDLGREQIKLVTLSACESAAVTAQEHLHHLGLIQAAAPPSRDTAAENAGTLPAMAAALVDRLDCAVLAMRYPVVDDFAIALADRFYRLLLGKGQPVSQALALTLPRVAPQPPTAEAPALSIATPALFGARAAELILTPPPGGPAEVEGGYQKLAGFPPQPDRFVGRVGPMTRATAALAPRSGRTGVVFHGMAGGGKTACAVELAYAHQESFPLMAFHAAPYEGHDITTALSDFAFALERQVRGLKLAHLVGDTAALRAGLPGLTEVMENNRILIVLDNIESLLAANGQWRDERWELLVGALTNHRGLARLVLTTRQRPVELPESMIVEPVHALSLPEAVLLARDWPNLCALITAVPPPAGLTADQSRELAARTLHVVQGHPKLIELADGQAADPARLSARLDEADATWLTAGTRLDEFRHSGEPTATESDYLTVLQGWTRATTATLPPASSLLFQLLCCLEDDDRVWDVLDAVWPDLWRRLGRPGEAPDLDAALAPLGEHALVAAEVDPDTGRAVRWRIHPGVADTARTTSSTARTGDSGTGSAADVRAAVDAALGDFWLASLRYARRQEHAEEGRSVLRAARCAVPYLLRHHRWNDLGLAASHLLGRDPSTATAAALLPMLAAAEAAVHGTETELLLAGVHAHALAILHPDRAKARLHQLLATAEDREEFDVASEAAEELIKLYLDEGRRDEALFLAMTKAGYTRRVGRGPWSQLRDEGTRLQILLRWGNDQQVLDEVLHLRDQWASLPDPPDLTDLVVAPWQVREVLLNLGVLAALNLRRWQQALDLNAEILASMRRRGASDGELAVAAFNDYGPLLRLGRPGQARDLLIGCRAVFDAINDIPMLAKTIAGLAEVEGRVGHRDRATALVPRHRTLAR